MPRYQEDNRENRHHGRDSSEYHTKSSARSTRSRSRDRSEYSRSRRSPGYQHTNPDKMNRDKHTEKDRRSYKQSSRIEEGRWANRSSGSDNEDRENKEIKRRRSSPQNRKKSDHPKHHETKDSDRHAQKSLDTSETNYQKSSPGSNVKEEIEKQGPNMGLSGKLMEDTNVFNGVTVKYSEPPEAKKPKRRWRFYVFKGEETMPVLHLHRQSAYLMGKDRKVADIPIDHPSCSRQHAALQYRCIPGKGADGQKIKRVLPYIIDLESSNGTFLNNKKIEPKKYHELREKDVLKFGFSSREYVLLHDQSDHGEDSD